MSIEINKDFLSALADCIREQNSKSAHEMLVDLHPADIAEFFPQLELEEQSYLISLLDNEVSAAVMLELEEDDRKKLLRLLSPKEIAEDLITEMDTDDAVDVISELSEAKKDEVIAQLEDKEHAQDIVDLLRYDEDTAGGLMRKEFVKVNKNWNVITAVREMRRQAEDLEEVYSIYVVNDDNELLGTLSLKKLLTTSSSTKLEELYNKNVHYVKAGANDEDVAKIIQKYDLMEIPVVDELMRLQGIITVDDIIDVMREEAEEDYQLAAGITRNVDADDSIWTLTKARLPWLLIGMFGGLCAASIINGFTVVLEKYKVLLLFVPLIQSTAGNVGIQSSAIIVQGLANGTIKGEVWKLLWKEFLLGLLNGLGIAIIVLFFSHFWFGTPYLVSATICVALVTVIIIAATIGTFIPLFLSKRGLDPAVSTGPFITTSNDIFGVFIYFMIAKMLLGF
ncbi:magnesium transporter [Moheibacter sediminis]|uniref:Magnesium transporter MgtE n=1 Tax=Moheibacter sediminis TaxID=1434700 RepID=A0A1W2B1U6_9FLAO|nr:magnesium transporter [Moheibacter sediminis]SMC66388.1 magnesium transporter [Moheibacter sediminis]